MPRFALVAGTVILIMLSSSEAVRGRRIVRREHPARAEGAGGAFAATAADETGRAAGCMRDSGSSGGMVTAWRTAASTNAPMSSMSTTASCSTGFSPQLRRAGRARRCRSPSRAPSCRRSRRAGRTGRASRRRRAGTCTGSRWRAAPRARAPGAAATCCSTW